MVSLISLAFPWPPKTLSPNARVTHFQRAAAFKVYKAKARKIARDFCVQGTSFVRHPHPLFPEGRVHISIRFFPPAGWHFDEDNMVARFKAGADGIRDALGIDDRFFHWDQDWGEEIVEDGIVMVSIEVEDNNAQSSES